MISGASQKTSLSGIYTLVKVKRIDVRLAKKTHGQKIDAKKIKKTTTTPPPPIK